MTAEEDEILLLEDDDEDDDCFVFTTRAFEVEEKSDEPAVAFTIDEFPSDWFGVAVHWEGPSEGSLEVSAVEEEEDDCSAPGLLETDDDMPSLQCNSDSDSSDSDKSVNRRLIPKVLRAAADVDVLKSRCNEDSDSDSMCSLISNSDSDSSDDEDGQMHQRPSQISGRGAVRSTYWCKVMEKSKPDGDVTVIVGPEECDKSKAELRFGSGCRVDWRRVVFERQHC